LMNLWRRMTYCLPASVKSLLSFPSRLLAWRREGGKEGGREGGREGRKEGEGGKQMKIRG
jgi:hypothetical protein